MGSLAQPRPAACLPPVRVSPARPRRRKARGLPRWRHEDRVTPGRGLCRCEGRAARLRSGCRTGVCSRRAARGGAACAAQSQPGAGRGQPAPGLSRCGYGPGWCAVAAGIQPLISQPLAEPPHRLRRSLLEARATGERSPEEDATAFLPQPLAFAADQVRGAVRAAAGQFGGGRGDHGWVSATAAQCLNHQRTGRFPGRQPAARGAPATSKSDEFTLHPALWRNRGHRLPRVSPARLASALIRFQSSALGTVVICRASMQRSSRCGRVRSASIALTRSAAMLLP